MWLNEYVNENGSWKQNEAETKEEGEEHDGASTDFAVFFFIRSHSMHLDIHSRWELYVSPTSIYVVTLFALFVCSPVLRFQ